MMHRSCGRFSWINEGQRSAAAFDGDSDGNGDGIFSRNEERFLVRRLAVRYELSLARLERQFKGGSSACWEPNG